MPETGRGPGRYSVVMTVTVADMLAANEAEALQRGCDLLHPFVVDARLGINEVHAIKRDELVTAEEFEAAKRLIEESR